MSDKKHAFALYYKMLTALIGSLSVGDDFTLDDKAMVHRIIHIIRLRPGDSFLLFDCKNNTHVIIKTIKKADILCTLQAKAVNSIVQPSITFLLPLLKRGAIEEAIYSLVELGANEIQLVITDKVQRRWSDKKEFDRLKRILYAAAEQSKNYAFPILKEPQLLTEVIPQYSCQSSIFFDSHGKHLDTVIQALKSEKKLSPLVLMVGPEGDLTVHEKKLLKKHNVIFCSLTQTILRSQQAAAVSLGIFRSFFR